MNRLLFQSSYNDSRSWKSNAIGSMMRNENFVTQRPSVWCSESWSMEWLRAAPYPVRTVPHWAWGLLD